MMEANPSRMSRYGELFTTVIVIQAALLFSIAFRLSVAQSVLGFLFVSILPGIIIVQFLGAKLERVEKIIFSVGTSLAFFMAIGLLTNFVYPVFGLSAPLETAPIFVTASVIMDVLAVCLWKFSRSRDVNTIKDKSEQLRSGKTGLLVLLLCLLPLLSAFGSILTSIPPYSNNILSLSILIAVSVIVIGVAAYKHLSSEAYVLILFSIALALVFQTTFFSNYLAGGDIFGENSVLNLTLQHSYWDFQIVGKLNGMLSVTILPTIYSNLTGISGTWIFKIIYPTILGLVPVGVYQLFKSQIDKRLAFLSVFFFALNFAFFSELAELPRQIIGELFFVLLFLTMFKKDLNKSYKVIFFTIFSFGIIVSHYAMSYIFLGFIAGYWVVSYVLKHKTAVNLSMIVLFASIMFGWYIYTSSGSNFSDLVVTLQNLGRNFFSDFFSSQSRGTIVLEAFGATPIHSTIIREIGQYMFNLTELLIVLGLAVALLKSKWGFFKNDFNVFALFSLGLLALCVVVPNFAGTFNAERFYQVALFFLSPFCIMGGIWALQVISRKRISTKILSLILLVIVLVPVFLFETGFVYEVTKQDTYSLPLSSYRLSDATLAYYGVFNSSQVNGAQWLAKYKNPLTLSYTDEISISVLQYASTANIFMFNGSDIPLNSTIFLESYSYSQGIYLTEGITWSNLTQVIPPASTENTIYSSGSCLVYQCP